MILIGFDVTLKKMKKHLKKFFFLNFSKNQNMLEEQTFEYCYPKTLDDFSLILNLNENKNNYIKIMIKILMIGLFVWVLIEIMEFLSL